MLSLKRFIVIAMILVLALSSMGFAPAPKKAACTAYHTVHRGESLSWIGRYYGVPWTWLAQINNIKSPYVIYPGQVLCVSTSSPVPPTPPASGWSYKVVKVEQDVSVSIRTSNFPDNVLYAVYIGRKESGAMNWVKVADLDSDRGGTFNASFNIPVQFVGASQLAIRLTQAKKNLSKDQWFTNSNSGSGGQTGYTGIPTIWIVSVVRDNQVEIQTHNFPPGLVFDVLMGPMGTRGVNGYKVGTLNSGAGGTMTAIFNIPPQLYGHSQISIRTQNAATGYFSYNWFYNNTTH
jgi:LysM repeat protein